MTNSSTEAPSGDGKGVHRAARAGSVGVGLAALVLGLLLGGFAMTLVSDDGDGEPFGDVVESDGYQAVILSNDKVYFGQIAEASDEFYRLDNAFFLQETQASADADPERALLPLNREIHAPENTMLIRKDEIVLVENLAGDSPILAEIERQRGGD